MAPVRTLERGLEILERVIANDKPVRLRDVADEFDIDRAMAFRFLQTLCEFGLLHKDARSKAYSPGSQFYSWMIRARRRLDIVEVARPYLREVVNRTEQSAHLGILVDNQVLLVDFVPSDNVISVKNRIGVLEPLYCTAIGKAIAMRLPSEEWERILDGLELKSYTPRTITKRKALDQHLAEANAAGYAFDDGEFNELLACVAVPLKGPDALPAMSMGVSLIRPVIADDKGIIKRVASQLKDVAADLETLLLNRN